MATIREARPSDALAVAEVHVRSWQRAYRGIIPDDYLDALDPAERAARYTFGARRPTDPLTIVVSDAGRIVGFASFGPGRDPDLEATGELFALYVDPDGWGTGLGQALLVEARARLRADGWSSALLWVLVENERAQHFYRRDGWMPDGSTRHESVHGTPAHVERWRRALT